MMGRTSGADKLLLVAFLAVVCCSAAAASSSLRKATLSANPKYSHYTEEYRRNLLANGLGLTPPMGWNSWNHFACQIDEKMIRETGTDPESNGAI